MSTVPSPLDPAQLQSVLAPTLEESRTLPKEAYLSPEVFAWEQEHLLEGSWICLGRAGDLREAGDQKAFRIGSESILLVRDRDGSLNGFYNVCRHRGHELLECGATRNLRAIKCPYHAWIYALDGKLSGAPRFGDVPGFDKADYPLIRARVHEWNGWVFANPTGDAPEFSDHAGNLGELLAPWEIDGMFVGAVHNYAVKANWKTITENYHECYHCPSIHPALCEVTPPDSGDSYQPTGAWVGGSMELKGSAATMSLTGESKGVPIRGLSRRQMHEVYYFGLFPNLLISLHPDYVMTHRMDPIGPGETAVECAFLFPPEAREREDFDPGYAAEFWDITNKEDWVACESIQRGLASHGRCPGPFAREEDEVHAFMGLVARAYLEGHVGSPPAVRSGLSLRT